MWSFAFTRTVSPDDLNAKEVSVLRQLVDYLQLRMHVFRFDGETSWRTGYYVRTCDPFPCLVSLRESTRVPFLKATYSLPSGNRLLPPSIALFDWFPPQVNKPYQTYERGCHPRDSRSVHLCLPTPHPITSLAPNCNYPQTRPSH